MIILAALTGARRGELCALRWSDIDLTGAGSVRSRSMLDLPNSVEEKATKSHQERTSPWDAGLALVQLHRDAMLERALSVRSSSP